MTRAEHVEWSKQRALEYVDHGDVVQAFSSLASDLRKHPATEDHPALQLGAMLQMSGHLSTSAEMREFIEGVN